MKLTHFLALSAALLGTAAAAHAQTVSPVPAPTIITSLPYTINAPGYYQLGANLTSTATTGALITIAVGNVTLDFAGHYISGPTDSTSISSGQLYGVYSYERGNIKVLNGTVAYCYVGIDFAGSGAAGSTNVNQLAQNMLVTYCSHIGIYFNGTSFSSVTGCNVTNIGGTTVAGIDGNYGIYLNGALGSVVQDDTVNTVAVATTVSTTAGYGIFGSATATAVVSNCRVFNSYNGIYSNYNGTAKFGFYYNFCLVDNVTSRAPNRGMTQGENSNF